MQEWVNSRALLLRLPNGIGLLFGAILATVAYDVGGLFLGSSAALIPAACIASLTVCMNLLVDWFQQRQQGETVLEKIDE